MVSLLPVHRCTQNCAIRRVSGRLVATAFTASDALRSVYAAIQQLPRRAAGE
jgi:hypothetical protein